MGHLANPYSRLYNACIMSWTVLTVAELDAWFGTLTDREQEAITAVVRVLAAEGPMLGRPFVDRIAISKFHNMKELRPRGIAKHIRILFIFDPQRAAVLLLGGNKKGQWERWYRRAVPEADSRYERYLEETGVDDP